MSARPPNKRIRLLWRWGGGSVAGVACLVVILGFVGRADRSAVPSVGLGVEGVTSVLTRKVGGDDVPIHFEDVSAQSGIAFRHFPGQRESLLPEDMGSGVACGDYDGDGRDDLFFVNFAGSVTPGATLDRQAGRSRLYRNLGGFRFDDVTDASGIDFAGFGMGAAWGDYDNDGDLDLYIAAYGSNVLYQNQGNGTFRDVTETAGVQDKRFSSGASWADYDRDGDLDLYVSNYVDFVFRESDRGVTVRYSATEEPFTLNPNSYPAQPNSLFRNRGDGTFEDVAQAAGVANLTGKSLSASWTDLDNDGWLDLYVANDVSENGVFRNRGDGTFEDIGPSSLAADYRSAMGLAVSDFDNDLDLDLLITHWLAQENALYQNMLNDPGADREGESRLWFLDAADELGLGQISLDMVGWATSFADFDNDGRRDVWVVNGSTLEERGNHRLLRPQPALLFWNRGGLGFVDIAARSCPRLRQPFVGRGGIQADLDGDGRLDLVWPTHSGPVIVLKNTSTPMGHWFRVRLLQESQNRFALGARAYVTTGTTTQMGEVGGSSSYLSQDELTLHFGLGKHERVDRLRIVWPDGAEETLENFPADRLISHARTAEPVDRAPPAPSS